MPILQKAKVKEKEKVANLKILVHLHQQQHVDVLTWDQVTSLILPEPVGVVLVIQLQPRKSIIDYINSRGERAYIIIQILDTTMELLPFMAMQR